MAHVANLGSYARYQKEDEQRTWVKSSGNRPLVLYDVYTPACPRGGDNYTNMYRDATAGTIVSSVVEIIPELPISCDGLTETAARA
ncbi:hypothetical protein ElyMa_005350400 [Elysia marginata]|uniref:Uncharacterized protein n=1 Tax=Elysia marginata TaxID=1093978 RepID=A0AAV4EB82_9GAST|nr:hypothetical protein ElyMa_005350400 [Elysia marginata]